MSCSKVAAASSACMGRAVGAIAWRSNDSGADRVRGGYLGDLGAGNGGRAAKAGVTRIQAHNYLRLSKGLGGQNDDTPYLNQALFRTVA